MSAIEYCGKLIILSEVYTNDELWFIASNINQCNMTIDELCNYSRIWNCSKKLHCTYSDAIMEKCKELESNLFIKRH